MALPPNMDPEIATALEGMPIAGIDLGSIDVSAIPAMRAALADQPRPPAPPTTVTPVDHAASPDVTVRVLRDGAQESTDAKPCIFWIHGGGYMFGSALVADARLDHWAKDLDCVVASVEYRLAPEHPYPTPLEDCYTGLKWVADNAAELGVDPDRIVIAGASAGGGLAAGLALLARDRGEVSPVYQLLIYPMIDDRNATASSHIETVIWTRSANFLGWRAYLGQEPGGDDVPAYAAPARAKDLAGLPPAFVAVGTLDVFRDEDVEYALRLLASGVETELHVYPGAPHGFDSFIATADVSRRCNRDIDGALARALHGHARALTLVG